MPRIQCMCTWREDGGPRCELRWSTVWHQFRPVHARKTQPLITIRVAAPSASARKSRTGCTRSLHRLAYFSRHSHRQRQRSRAVAFWLAGSSQADCLDRGHTVDTRLRHGIVPHIATFVLATVIHVFFLGAKQAAGWGESGSLCVCGVSVASTSVVGAG